MLEQFPPEEFPVSQGDDRSHITKRGWQYADEFEFGLSVPGSSALASVRMTKLRSALGEAVRAARRKRGWSQEYLAELADLDRTYMSGVERGTRNPGYPPWRRSPALLKWKCQNSSETRSDGGDRRPFPP